MAIHVKTKTYGEDSPETAALKVLKDQFEKELGPFTKSSNGEILIVSNVTLFGQETKDIDLIVIGKLQNFKLQITANAKNKNFEVLPSEKRETFINNFCWIIEVKDHSFAGVKQDGLNLLVKYNDKWSDATNQSEKQKYALVNYLNENLGFSPTICNFIWLRNISNNELVQLNQNRKDNLLPTSISFFDLVTKSTYQSTPFKPDHQPYCIINCIPKNHQDEFDLTSFRRVFNLFSEVRQASGELTRKKIEQITRTTLDKQQYAENIGNILTIIAGRAGTGKTVRLLRIACDLAINKGCRSIILTYNHALVSDIRRILALAGIPDGIDSYTVQISTLHKFFFQVYKGLGLGEIIVPQGNNFNEVFMGKMGEMLSYLEEELINEKDIQELMRKEHEAVGWDYIMIDEAQDWSDVEKNVLFRIFGPGKIIVADGIDQFIRSGQKQIWAKGFNQRDFQKKTETKGMRQKYNLVNFVNQYAKVSGLNWEVTPDKELYGGRIIITTKPYNVELHNQLGSDCYKNLNTAYDMLFLVPPQMVDKTDPAQIHFSKYDEYRSQGIRIFDGTNLTQRSQYPTNLEHCRLFQYDSCRGLEGWTTVCLDFDQLFQYKMDSFVDKPNEELALETPGERANRYVTLWTLMPLTRAIDTLVITISDSESEIARRLKEVAKKMPDVIEWLD